MDKYDNPKLRNPDTGDSWTAKDEIAKEVLGSLLNNKRVKSFDTEELVVSAYDFAEAFLKERMKRRGY